MQKRNLLTIERRVAIAAALFFFALLFFGLNVEAQQMIHGGNGIELPPPPVAAVHTVVDDYHGVKIEDPYRWLEDAKSPETRAWIDAENAYTQKYFSQVKIRPEVVTAADLALPGRLLYRSAASRREVLLREASGGRKPDVHLLRDGWKGADERLIDATKLSADQNTSVNILDISENGDLLVYGVRQGGADELIIHTLDVKTRTERPDVLPADDISA